MYASRKKIDTDDVAIFLPLPPSRELRHEIITGMHQDVNPVEIEESGCVVCGKLTLNIELTSMTDVDINWDLLIRPGVTRKERFSDEDAIEELDGPILAHGCGSICVDCEARLRTNIVPLFSLANKLWIGKVPWQLRNLSFAEKVLIVKVRQNRCVVRVPSGKGKMSANAIMFSAPVVKVYNILPPSLDEICEVLAVRLCGAC
ncbi:hypothetical protein B0H13DRAFT_1662968 [Mycena leptocephala]|nr:hypothetical protein B0H13DRAFT_1662968 [Mycena leptocephala]